MKQNTIIKAGLLLYIIYHIVSLSYSPLPWFDEVSFASMTHSFYTEGSLFEKVRSYTYPEPRLEYGPIYFALQACVVKLLGLSLFVFRINGVIFGFVNIYLVHKICQKFNYNLPARLVTMALLVLNPVFNQSMHSGRMDMLALFFFLSSFILLLKVYDGSLKSSLYALCVGLLLASAMLTTPRIVFAFPICIVWGIYSLYYLRARLNILLPYSLALVTFGAIYFCWIYFAFGDIPNYINYYTQSDTLNRHIGGTSQPQNYQIGITIFSLIIGAFAFFNGKNMLRHAIFPLAATGLIFFHIVVAGSQIYYAFAIPLSALIIGWSYDQLKDKLLFRFATYGVVLAFASTFFLKLAVVFASLPQRDEDYYTKAYTKYIPPNVSVAGDFTYYYMALKNNNPFESVMDNGPYDGIAEYILKNRTKYIVLNKRNPKKELFEQILLNKHYRLISTVENKKRIPVLSDVIDYLPWFITTDYSCSIYQLIDQ